MLSLNSYGLAKASNQHLTLPRLNPPAIRSSNTLSVGKLAQERRDVHPWYRTTSGFEYGRHVDFQDIGLNVSPVNPHAKHMDFTHGFLQGPYTDSSLGSLDMKKKRLVLSDKLRAEHKIRMQAKFDEKQLQLNFKREVRRELRDKRRLELTEKTHASSVIQRHVRGMLARTHVAAAHSALAHVSAVRIQSFCRSKMRIYHAKLALQRIKDDLAVDAACVIQRKIRDHLAKRNARAELQRRREQRSSRRQQIQKELMDARRRASVAIQRIGRGLIVRQRMRRRRLVADTGVPNPFSSKRKQPPLQTAQVQSKQQFKQAAAAAPSPAKPPGKKKASAVPAPALRRLSSVDSSLNDA
ncbi:hypothetical protein H257_08708 [Aphanomyces astaci]|uniref:Uncharacterized protein n=1 Tax=Aphanomyces astaci TaxID=112090 RepID=W4GD97_APHAT|nr:hypothetical protein H257_08708 [Aphanomyces astaci]ETV77251.1 hypothetical protein H257_08708 [Aphanomyces astaci]|eukprot:XP_009833038.1 hypothetical protein H257_08708 [Aphanomyces astaci]